MTVCAVCLTVCTEKGQYTKLFCGQGELFRVPEVKQRTEEYLGYFRQAGREFAEGGITAGTRAALDQLLFPRSVFESMANASWGAGSGRIEIDGVDAREIEPASRCESYGVVMQNPARYYTFTVADNV